MKKMVKVAALAAMVMSVALTGCNGKKEEVSPSNTEASAKSKSPMKAPKIPSYLYRIKYQGMIWLGAKDKDRLPADLVIPEGVTGILKDAFLDCTSLTSVTLADTVQRIGTGAFSGCTSLASVTISEGVTIIYDEAFRNCTSLARVAIPSSVTKIDNYAFKDCASLAYVTIPEGVQEIGTGAFSGCTSLASIAIPEGVTEIGYDVFKDCTSLASVTIPNSVKTIHDTAFLSCPIKEFKYAGTKEQWESISKGSALSTEGGDFVVQCTDDITEDAVVSSATE
ncbi:MAG: leucine-rich repeat domain-containing protein [Treponemataceae bacterium]|nr:leucine-rich repeat domain-containing protein [Treponemataceae bacterium]